MRSFVSTVSLPGRPEFRGSPFPPVLHWDVPRTDMDSVTDWVASERTRLVEDAEVHGAVLFRGFPLSTAQDFDAFIAAFQMRNFPYEESLSNAVRINRTERVFTANEAPAEVTICLHHEMAQTPVSPSRLFFFCEKPADSGGATPLCRSDILFERLSAQRPGFADDCRSKGLLYTNVMPAQDDPKSGMGRSWQSTLRAADRDEAENRLGSLGYTWEWLDGDCLRVTTPKLPAVLELPDGRHTFFNQLIAAFTGWKDSRNDPSKAILFGDGSPLDPDDVDLATRIADELTFDIPWQCGDVALVDNRVTMHGRRTFDGTRKVLASLVAGQ